MAEFKIRLAGYPAAVQSLFDSTRDYCRAYLTEEAAVFSLAVSREDMVREQAYLDAEALEEGLKRRKFSDPFLERAVIQRKAAQELFSRSVLMLHGSTVAVDGEAYLFTAKCGTGKSTHTRLWREVFRERAVMVNDDKPFLKLTEDGVLACGSPWNGKHGLDSNITVPLKGICILERGSEDRIQRIGPEEAREMLLHQGFCPDNCDQSYEAKIGELMEKTPLYRMQCTKEPSAARTAYRAMAGREE